MVSATLPVMSCDVSVAEALPGPFMEISGLCLAAAFSSRPAHHLLNGGGGDPPPLILQERQVSWYASSVTIVTFEITCAISLRCSFVDHRHNPSQL